jgi:hypothetical protein
MDDVLSQWGLAPHGDEVCALFRSPLLARSLHGLITGSVLWFELLLISGGFAT